MPALTRLVYEPDAKMKKAHSHPTGSRKIERKWYDKGAAWIWEASFSRRIFREVKMLLLLRLEKFASLRWREFF